MPPSDECLETVEDSLINRMSVLQMLYYNALQQVRRHAGIPDAFRIHDDDRSAGAHAEAGRLAALHPTRTEKQTFALEQPREGGVERAALAVRRAEPADAHEHVACIRLHDRGGLARKGRHAA